MFPGGRHALHAVHARFSYFALRTHPRRFMAKQLPWASAAPSSRWPMSRPRSIRGFRRSGYTLRSRGEECGFTSPPVPPADFRMAFLESSGSAGISSRRISSSVRAKPHWRCRAVPGPSGASPGRFRRQGWREPRQRGRAVSVAACGLGKAFEFLVFLCEAHIALQVGYYGRVGNPVWPTSRKRLSMPSSCWRSLLSAISSFRLIGGKLCSETFFYLHFSPSARRAFAVHAVHMSLRAERVGVDALYYPANGHGFDFCGTLPEALSLLSWNTIPCLSGRHPRCALVVDGCGYLFPLGGKRR